MTSSPRPFRPYTALLLAILVAGCGSDLITAPRGTPAASEALPVSSWGSLREGRNDDDDDSGGPRLRDHFSNVRLFACTTPEFGRVTRRIGPWGGRIEVGPHTLFVPPGALRRTVQITAHAPAGQTVRVMFRPHGLKFREGATLVLSYKHCGNVGPRRPRIAYVDELDDSILELLRTKHQWQRQSVSTSLRHFSGYAIAD